MFQRKANSGCRTSTDRQQDSDYAGSSTLTRSHPRDKIAQQQRQHQPDEIQQHLVQQSSVIKIIDIQKTSRRAKENMLANLRNQQHREQQQEEEEEERRRSGSGSTVKSAIAGRSSLPPAQQFTSAEQAEAGSSNRCTSNSSQQPRASGSPQQQQKSQNQKQPSGETLSSFESDYDLLVYLGETETEDIVDTEKSLDYQDQTWRQSICGGASLAPTIDGSLNELSVLAGSSSPYARDFDLLNTPLGEFGATRQVLESSTSVSNYPLQRSTRKSPNPKGAPNLTPNLHNNSNLRLNSPQSPQRTPSDTECDREVTLAFGEFKNRHQDFNQGLRLLSPSQESNLRSRTLGKENRVPNDDLQHLQKQSRTMERPTTGGGGPRLSGEAAELDRLLAEMSQSLDLDALARYDMGDGSHQRRQQQQQKSTAHSHRLPPAKLSETQATNKLTKASNESILDEYDGASRILEQMIADQLDNQQATNTKTNQPALMARTGVPRPSQVPIAAPSQVQPRHPLQREQSQSSVTTSRESPKSVVSAFRMRPIQTTIEVKVEPSIERSSLWRPSKLSNESDCQDLPPPPPPPPPPKDYELIVDGGVIRLEADDPSSSSSEEEEEDKVSVRQYQVSGTEAPDTEEAKSEPFGDRMKRRTMSSMRSMRHKFSDLMSEAGRRASRSNQGRSSASASRAASVGPSSNLQEHSLDLAENEKRPQQRESRAPRRRQDTQGSSFGQQLRERLSRSKSRVSKWLLKSSRWQREPRARSQPNTRQFEESKLDEDDGQLLQFQPGDIARNSSPKLEQQKLTTREASSPDSFNRSLDRHLALDLKKRAFKKGQDSQSDMDMSQLSGLDISSSVRTPRLSRSRSMRRTGAPVAGASNQEDREQEKRANSLISLKRLSASFRSNPKAKRQEIQDLDEMQVKVSDSIKKVVPAENSGAKRRRKRRGKRKSATGELNLSQSVSQSSSSSSPLSSPKVLNKEGSNSVAKDLHLTPMLTTDQYLAPAAPQSSQSKRELKEERAARDSTSSKSHLNLNLNPNTHTRGQLVATEPNSFRPKSACALLAPTDDTKELNQQMSSPITPLEPVGPAASPAPFRPEFESEPHEFGQHREHQRLAPFATSKTTTLLRVQHVSSPRAVLDGLRHKCSGLFGGSSVAQQPQRPPRKRTTRSKSAGPPREASTSKLETFAQQLKHSAANVFQPVPKRSQANQETSKGKFDQRNERKLSTPPKSEAAADLVEWRPVIEVRRRNQRQLPLATNYSGGTMPVTSKVESCDEGPQQQQNSTNTKATTLEKPSIRNRLLLFAPENSLDTDTTWDSTDLDVGAEDVRRESYKTDERLREEGDESVEQAAQSNKLEADKGLARRKEQQQQRQQQQVAVADDLGSQCQQPQTVNFGKQQLAKDDDVDDVQDLQALHLHKFNADWPPPLGAKEKDSEEEKMTAVGREHQQITHKSKQSSDSEDANKDANGEDGGEEKRLSVYENVSETRSRLLPASPRQTRSNRDSSAWATDEPDDEVPAKPARPTKQNQQKVNFDEKENNCGKPAHKVAERRLISMLSITQDPNDQLMVTHSSSPVPEETQTSSASQSLPPSQEQTDPNNNNGSLMTLLEEEDDDSVSFGAVAQNRQRLLARFEPPKSAELQVGKRPAPKSGAFIEGKGAAASSQGSSRVKRLAQTFEAAVSGSVGHKDKENLQQQHEDDIRSEVSNSWYDADQLDEQEVAKFLEEFDGNGANDVSAARTVSTGADPFVTVADSTLADEAGEASEADEARVADDDTLNDGELDDDDDDLENALEEEKQAEVGQGKVAPSQSGQANEAEKSEASETVGVSDAPIFDAAAAAATTTTTTTTTTATPDLERQVNKGDDAKGDGGTTTNSSAAVSIIELHTTPSKQQHTADNADDDIKSSSLITFNHNSANKPTTTDNSAFRANLSELIGRQSQSQPQPQSQSRASEKSENMESQKELKGLTRYYRAILSSRNRHRRHKQRRKENNVDEIGEEAVMEDYIHSGSSSSESESENESSGEEENSESVSKVKVPDNRRLVKDAKKCFRLYEELERLLANRRRWAEESVRRKPICEDDDLDLEEEEASINSGDTDQVSLSSSSAVSYESIPELKQRQNLQKLYNIVKEIHSSEEKFVDTLRLLNEDFRQHMAPLLDSQQAQSKQQSEAIRGLLKHLPQLQALNENLLDELGKATKEWPKTKKIAHVLVKIGPFLKHYSTYIREFDSLQVQLNDALKKWPQVEELVRKFETSDRCQRLSIQHHLLRPIQRIPQYRLLLQQYLQHLKPDDADYEDTVEALEVVSRVAEHANQSMSEGANFSKLLALQAKIVHKQRDLVQPGRFLIKEGELMKVCRKQEQPRYFVLLNDALLYLTQIQSSDILYLNNELPLDECRVTTSNEQNQSLVGQQFETEFSVCAKTRSFHLVAKSRDERDDWVKTLRKTIDEHLARRRSFSVSASASASNNNLTHNQDDKSKKMISSASLITSSTNTNQEQSLLGQQAPLWTPDSRVTMCQLCTSTFSALFRRHHCRACGRVVCSACSNNKAPLMYLKCRPARVCDLCFRQLRANLHLYYNLRSSKDVEDEELKRLDEHFRTLLRSQFVRGNLDWPAQALQLHRLARPRSHSKLSAPLVAAQNQLRQLGANDQGSLISGYLHRRHVSKAKWKRQWFVIRDKVLYAFRAIDDVAPASSLPLLGFQVRQPKRPIDGLDPRSLLQLIHISSHKALDLKLAAKEDEKFQSASQIIHLFKAESVGAAERWFEALSSSVVLD